MEMELQSLPFELQEEHNRRKKWLIRAYIIGILLDIFMISSTGMYSSMKDLGAVGAVFAVVFMFVFAGGVFCSLAYGMAYVSEKNKDTMRFLAVVLPVVGWIILLYYILFLLFFKGAAHLLPDTVSFIKRGPILTRQERKLLAQGQYVPANAQYGTPVNVQYGAQNNGQYGAPNNNQQQ